MRTLLGLDPLLLSQLISVTLRAAKWTVATNMDGVYTVEMYTGYVSLKP